MKAVLESMVQELVMCESSDMKAMNLESRLRNLFGKLKVAKLHHQINKLLNLDSLDQILQVVSSLRFHKLPHHLENEEVVISKEKKLKSREILRLFVL